MINFEIIFSVMIGGILSLLGTLLANYLQYRTEQRNEKRQRIKERYTEVHRYIAHCLDLADKISQPTVIASRWGADKIPPQFFQIFREETHELLSKINLSPVKGSSRILFVDDKDTMELLQKIDGIIFLFTMNFDELYKSGQMLNLEQDRLELKGLAEKIRKRLDFLVDKL